MAEEFVRNGFIRVDAAFPAELADECRERLWQQMDAAADDPTSWIAPLIRAGYQEGGPFEQAANTPRLREAYDLLVGSGRWMPRTNLGTFAIRFPSTDAPDDDGWHIDSSYPPSDPGQTGDPFAWRVNVASRGRALLMLFLLSDVSVDDAPTRVRVGSHLDVAALLAPFDHDGLSMMQASQRASELTANHPVALATGGAGDVYLCHPFLVHAAQAHHGTHPRFLAQPPLHLHGWVNASFDPINGNSPVEAAIRTGIQLTPPPPSG